MRQKIVSILCLVIFCVGGCKEMRPVCCTLQVFDFILLDPNGQPLLLDAQSPIKVYYIDNGGYYLGPECRDPGCTMVNMFPPGYAYPAYYKTAEAVYTSLNKKIRDFYIDLNGDVDTVNLLVLQGSQAPGIAKVTFNGREVSPSPVGDSFPDMFILKKK